jgi:hypothetical protein
MDLVVRIFIYSVDTETYLTAYQTWSAIMKHTTTVPARYRRYTPSKDLFATPEQLRIDFDRAFGLYDGDAFTERIKTTNFWGRQVWRVIHRLAANTDNITAFRILLRGLYSLLPCPKCSNHYRQLVARYDMDIEMIKSTRDALNLSLILHNTVSEAVYGKTVAITYPMTPNTVAATEHLEKRLVDGAGPSRRVYMEDADKEACGCE